MHRSTTCVCALRMKTRMEAMQRLMIRLECFNVNALNKSLQKAGTDLDAYPESTSTVIEAVDESLVTSKGWSEHIVDLKSERDRKKFTRWAALQSFCFSSVQDENSGKETLAQNVLVIA